MGRIIGIERITVSVFGPSGETLRGEVDSASVEELVDQMSRDPVREGDIERSTILHSRLKHILLTDKTINTTETKIGHGLGAVPFWYDVHVTTSATTPAWKQTRRPDDRFLYLIAEDTATVDILVKG